MDDFKAIKKYAYDFIIKHSIKSLNFTVDQIIKLIEQYGYSVFSYRDGISILVHLKKEKETYRNGFTYKAENSDNNNYVFFNNELPTEIQIDVLMHELAHIYLGHPNKPEKYKTPKEKSTEESNANALKLYIFSPFCVLKEYGIKTPEEIEELTCVLPDQITSVWEHYCTYETSKEDEQIIKQYPELLKQRQLLKELNQTQKELLETQEKWYEEQQKWNKALYWAIASTAWITAGIMILIYLIFLW